MEQQIANVFNELFLIIFKVAAPLAVLRLALAGLKTLAGEQEAMVFAIRQVGLGLFVIITARTLVWFVEQFSHAVAVIGP